MSELSREKLISQFNKVKWPIYLLVCICYILGPFHRIAPTIMGPELMRDLHLSAVDFGFLGLSYFWVYAAMQAPTGTLMDRFGPRRCLALLLIITAIGSITFSIAQSFVSIVIGRMIIAIATPALFMAGAKIVPFWFSSKQYPFMWGLYMSLGYIGGIAATSPMQFMMTEVGWRFTFLIIAGASFVLGILVFMIFKDRPADAGLPSPDELFEGVAPAPKGEKPKSNWRADWKEILKQPRFYLIAISGMGTLSSAQVLLGLWGGVYLTDVYHFSKPVVAELLTYWAVALVAGAFIAGSLIKLIRTTGVLLSGASIFLATWLYMTINVAAISTGEFKVIFLIFGSTQSYVVTGLWALVKEWSAPRQIGTATGLVNTCLWGLGSGLFQQIWGIIIQYVSKGVKPFPAEAFQTGMWLQACFIAISICCILVLRKVHKPYNVPNTTAA